MSELTEKEKEILIMLLKIGVTFTDTTYDVQLPCGEYLSSDDIYLLGDKLGVEIRWWL